MKRLSLETIEAVTPLYSRRFVRRRLQRVLFSFALALVTSVAFYYSYLDHSTYVWHEANVAEDGDRDYLAIYAGDPHVNWLGFPHRIGVTDIPTTALPTAVRPGVGSPLRSPLSFQVERSLMDQLSSEWTLVASVWRKDRATALQSAGALDVFDPPAPGTQQAVEWLASIIQNADLDVLEGAMTPDEVEISVPALRRIAWLDPDRAIGDLASDNFGLTGEVFDDPKEQRAVLEGLPPRCDSRVSSFLEKRVIHAEENSYEHNAWYGALLRTGCSVPERTLEKLLEQPGFIQTRQLDLLPYLAMKKPLGVTDFLRHQLVSLITRSQGTSKNSDAEYNASFLMWRDLRMLTVLDPTLVPDESTLLLISPYKHVRFAAARALLAKDRRYERFLVSSFLSDPWIDSALVDAGWFDGDQLGRSLMPLVGQAERSSGKFYGASIMYLLRMVRFRNPKNSQDFVQAVLSNAHQENFQSASNPLIGIDPLSHSSNSAAFWDTALRQGQAQRGS